MDAASRRQLIFAAALRVAKTEGLLAITGNRVAAECEVSTSYATVNHYFGTEARLRHLVRCELENEESPSE